MRGLQGILVALVLGGLGAVCNWLYIAKQASDYEKESFVVVSETARINVGDRFKAEDLDRLDLPRPSVGNLKNVAMPWAERQYLVGRVATKRYEGSELILREDIKTIGERDFAELLAKNEVARSIPVDSRSFVPERVDPKTLVSFEVPSPIARGNNDRNRAPSLATEVFGPYKIIALGNRTGDLSTMKAVGRSSGPQHVITIAVDYPMDDDTTRLFELIRLAGGGGVQVIIHSDDLELEEPGGAGPPIPGVQPPGPNGAAS